MNRSIRWLAFVPVLLICQIVQAATDWSAQEYDLYPGDFDGDGKTDLLYVAKDPGKASGIARSDGSAPNIPFQSWASNYLGIPWHGNRYNVVVGDYNFDSRADLFLQSATPGDSYVLLANAQGKFTAISQTVPNSSYGVVWSADQHRIISGDFDGDHRADLFLQATSSGGLNAVMLAGASGTFTSNPVQTWTDSPSPGGFRWSTKDALVHVGDFNADGRADLLVQARPKWSLIDFEVPIPVPVHAPNMNGVVLSRSTAPMFSSDIGYTKSWGRNANGADWSTLSTQVVVGDFNGDGRADVLLQAIRSSLGSRLVLADGSGNVFSGTSSPISANAAIDAQSARLVVGRFSGSGSAGLYVQSASAGGTNYIAGSIGSTITASAHNPAAATGTLPVSAVGITAGSFGISHQGSASYSIPIQVPPGAAGIQPGLSIRYQSGSGNGLLGMGFNLSGLSRIERCRKTFVQDGSTAAVQLAVGDRFCLDGNKLRLTSTSIGYGLSGSTYQTELEQFTRITAQGTAGNEPNYFTAEGKDGRRYEYGATADSRIESTAPGFTSKVRTWALNKVSDRYGNTMTITYQEDGATGNGAYRPASIAYTANAAASLDAPSKIDFVYEPRPAADAFSYYVAGGLITETQRLARIETRAKDASNVLSLVRQYRLSYGNSGVTPRSRLNAVQECDRSGNCLSPTTIGWQDGAAGWSDTSIVSPISTTAFAVNQAIDVDGDGRTDLVYPQKIGGINYWHVMRANASGGFDTPVASSINAGDDTNRQYSKVLAIDYYGNGRIGLLAQVPSQTNRKIIRWNGSGLEAVDTSITRSLDGSQWIGDFNGDGLMDFGYMDGTALKVQTNQGSAPGVQAGFATGVTYGTVGFGINVINPLVASQATAQGMQFDVNGDGRIDLLYRYESVTGCPPEFEACEYNVSFGVMISTPSGFTYSPSAAWGCIGKDRTCPQLVLGDFNGDGLSDFLLPESSGWVDPVNRYVVTTWNYHLGTGTGVAYGGVASIPTDVNFEPLVVDYDGDGRQDILTVSPGTPGCSSNLCVFRFTGSDFVGPVPTTLPNSEPRIIDLNGDGLMDIGLPGSPPYKVRMHRGGEPDLVSSIQDGFGNSVTVSYAPMTDGAVYSNATTAAVFPYMDVVRPIHLVRQYWKTDGIGGSYNVSASYNGLRYHLQGRGYTGFLSRTETDSRTGVATTYNYRQDFPYAGLVTSRQSVQSNGKPIQSTTATYLSVQTGTASNQQRYYPYLETQVENDYEVSSIPAVDGAAISQTSTTQAVDGWGNVTSITEVTSDLTGTGQTFTTQVVNTIPSFDVTNWCLDFVTQRTESRSTSALPALMRTTQFVLDPAAPEKCRARTETIEPSYADMRVDTTYYYDAFGHVNRADVTADGTTRINQTSYGPKGILPVSITNGANETWTRAYEYGTGALIGVTDPNQISIGYLTDGFGRHTRETRADGTATSWTLYRCDTSNSYCGDGLLRSQEVEQELEQNGTSVIRSSVRRFDSLGRAKYEESQVLSGAYSVVRTNYDNRGNISQESEPYLAGQAAYFTTTQFDVVNRPVSIQRQVSESDGSTQTTLIGRDRLTTTVTDAYGRSNVTLRDALGRVVRLTDAASGVTQYEYEQYGNLTRVTDPANNPVVTTYDRRGHRRTSTDPDLGFWQYEVYPTGELKKQTDAKGQITWFTYDGASRLYTRAEPEGTTTFNHGTNLAAKNIGKLASVTAPGGYAEQYVYDSLGRPQDKVVTIDAVNYTLTSSYAPATGMLDTLTFPTSTSAVTGSRLAIRYEYVNGFLKRVRDTNGPGTIYWEQVASDQRGNASEVLLGNGLRTYSTFDAVDGALRSRSTGTSGAIQNLSYEWDKSGNLTLRRDNNLNLTERFYYDSLYRLDYSTLNGVTNLDLGYDPNGNITSKTSSNAQENVGSYTYDTVRKHAVLAAGSHSYGYDANGNMNTRDGSSIAYTSYNLPSQVNSGSNSIQYYYGARRERFKQIMLVAAGGSLPAGTETTLSVDGLFEKVTKPTGVVEYKHYISAGSDPVAIMTLRSNGQNDTRYLHKDHLDGIDAITDAAGALVAHLSYGAYGVRRAASTWQGTPSGTEWSAIAAVTHRGLAELDHADNVGLIHMNGRMYDPLIGRFVSPDARIPDSLGTQGVNRYSYVGNNPLTLTDRTGFEPDLEEVTVTGHRSTDVFGSSGGGRRRRSPPARLGPPPRRPRQTPTSGTLRSPIRRPTRLKRWRNWRK